MVMKLVLSIKRNLEDVDAVIVSTDCKVLVVWRVLHALDPFSWSQKSANLFVEIIVIEDLDVSLVVGYSHVIVELGVGDGSCLLVSRETTHGGGSGSDLLGLVSLAIVELLCPDLAGSHELLVDDVVLMELVIVCASQVCTILLDDLKSPTLTLRMSGGNELLLSALNIDGDDSSAVLADEDETVHVVDGHGVALELEGYLSDVLEGSLVGTMNCDLEVLSS